MKRSELSGFAIDLGGTKTAAARIERGGIVDRLQTATEGTADAGRLIDTAAELLSRLGYASGVPLGVAVTGRLDRAGGWHAVNTGTLTGVSAIPLGDLLAARFGSARACNDAAAAAFAEALFGAGQGSSAFAYLTVSTGVGGGLVLDGRLLSSANGLAGHVGFSSSRFGTDRCGSGRMGTVESVASGRAIAKAAADAGHPGHDARGVFSAAASGEAWAGSLIDRSASAVAALCGDLTAILGLDRIALGGSIGLAPGYLDQVSQKLMDEPPLFRSQLVAASLGQDSGLLGALALAAGSD